MKEESRDLIVLGSGPGGYTAAIRASQLGRKVTVVEKEALGGVCLNWGCIPTKALLKSADVYSQLKKASEFGLSTGEIEINFPNIIERSREVASKLSAGVKFLMKKNNVEVIYGEGTLEKGDCLIVKNQDGELTSYKFNDIILATGGQPATLPGVEINAKTIHSSRTILESRTLPKKLIVVGAGAIGIEFASFFNALGTEVTVVEILEQILPNEDTAIARELQRLLKKKGLTILTKTSVEGIQTEDEVVSVKIKNNESEDTWSGDCCLLATGVKPNSRGIGLEQAGISIEKGFVQVDQFMRTNIPHYLAIGDLTGPPLLAHKASHEALVAAECVTGSLSHPMSYDNIPSCTYCSPQVASVGLTEKAASEKGLKLKVSKVPFGAIGKAVAIGETDGFTKVIVEEETGAILGVHIIHAEATELISASALIRSHEGVVSSVLDTICPHPTLSESLTEAIAQASGKPINT